MIPDKTENAVLLLRKGARFSMEQIEFMHPADQIVEIMQRIYDCGMTTTSGGNLSIMDGDGNMWISPSGIDKGTLTRKDIMCVKPDGTITGPHKPSSEYPFHRSIYKMRPDVKAILHAHPPVLVSFSVAGQVPDTGIIASAAGICGDIGFAGYDVPGSEALGKKVSKEFRNGRNSILLRNHGACVAGKTLLEAFKRFETLVFCAEMQMNAIRLGGVHTLTARQIAEAAADRNAKAFKGAFTPAERSADELEARQALVKLCARCYGRRIFTAADGVYAARTGKDSFIINPAEFDCGKPDIEDFVLIKGKKIESGKRPDARAWFAKLVFDRYPEINSLIIARPPCLTGYAVSHTEFNPLVIPESYIMLREMPDFKFSGAYGKAEDLLKKLSPRYPVVLVQNEGVISVGKSPLEAFDRMEVAEFSAQATITAPNLGGMTPINRKQVQDLVKAFKLPW